MELKPDTRWPVKNPVITSPYGYRIDPITGKPDQFHDGIDMVSSDDNKVFAIADGIVDGDFDAYVEKMRWLDEHHWSGNWCSIRHVLNNHYYWSLYVHLESNCIYRNERVTKGQLIGRYGNVGYATGPHLHLVIADVTMAGYARVNPIKYLPELTV